MDYINRRVKPAPAAVMQQGKQFISPAALKARYWLSQQELDRIVDAAIDHPIVWRNGQLEMGLAIACVKRLKGWA